MSQPFVEANFDFFSRTLSGAQQIQPRWRRCSIYADADLGEAVARPTSRNISRRKAKNAC